MNSYLILLHEIDKMPELSPEEMQAVISRYKAWGQRIRATGNYLSSGKLESTGRVVRAEAGKTRITDGPFTETKDVLGGYYLVQAESYDQAVELCQGSPHLDFGPIEVRRLEVV